MVALYLDSCTGLLFDNSGIIFYEETFRFFITLNIIVKIDFIGHYKLSCIVSV